MNMHDEICSKRTSKTVQKYPMIFVYIKTLQNLQQIITVEKHLEWKTFSR